MIFIPDEEYAAKGPGRVDILSIMKRMDDYALVRALWQMFSKEELIKQMGLDCPRRTVTMQSSKLDLVREWIDFGNPIKSKLYAIRYRRYGFDKLMGYRLLPGFDDDDRHTPWYLNVALVLFVVLWLLPCIPPFALIVSVVSVVGRIFLKIRNITLVPTTDWIKQFTKVGGREDRVG